MCLHCDGRAFLKVQVGDNEKSLFVSQMQLLAEPCSDAARRQTLLRVPSCAAKLCISEAYMRFLFYAGLVVGWAVPAILRIGNPFLFIAVAVLAWVPAGMVVTTFLQFVYPPRIIVYSSDFSNPLSLTQSKKDDL
jgi:hypothetical protein